MRFNRVRIVTRNDKEGGCASENCLDDCSKFHGWMLREFAFPVKAVEGAGGRTEGRGKGGWTHAEVFQRAEYPTV